MIICSVFGNFTAVTFVEVLKVPLSVVRPVADKSTEPTQLRFVVDIAELTRIYPLTEQGAAVLVTFTR